MARTAHTELAQAIHLGRSGHKDEAVAILRRVVAGDADCIPALLWLAGLTPDLGEGILALQHVLQLNPQNEAARRGLAELQARHPAQRDARDQGDRSNAVPARPEPVVSPAPDRPAPYQPAGDTVATPARTKPTMLPEPPRLARSGLEAPSTGRLRVVEGGACLRAAGEPQTRSRITIGLGTIGAACSTLVCAGVAIPLRLIGFTALIAWGAFVGATVIVTVSWMCLPLVRRLKHKQIEPTADRPGAAAIAWLLQDHLDGRWTLFRHLQLPGDRVNIDAVLTGPEGVFVLVVEDYAEFTRNVGDQWQQRNEGEWHDLEQNPSRQAKQYAVDLRDYLGQRGVSVWIAPRVVWAGPGRLILENPSVKIWHLRSPDSIWKEIEQGQQLADEVLARINSALAAKPGEPPSVKTPPR